jgi:hypothetical protein
MDILGYLSAVLIRSESWPDWRRRLSYYTFISSFSQITYGMGVFIIIKEI